MKIRKRGFTLAIEELEFFVPVTSEGMSKLLNIYNNSEEIQQEFLQEAEQFFALMKNAEDDLTKAEEPFNQLLEQRKALMKKMYDMVLGEGAFEKLYAYHPYIDDLEETFPDLMKEYMERAAPFLEEQNKTDSNAIKQAKDKRKKRMKK